ncbi:MFS transporter [Microbacterium sp.]|uniref:MFS transporter n=1 Tax=Microbacterium sp. TaxID=51671 RepID=UPI003221C05C
MQTGTMIAGGGDSDTSSLKTRPPIGIGAMLIMNFGFFGIQFSFGLQQTAVNPLFQMIGANPHDLPILNLAGPMTGLLIQPMIGALSDKTWSDRWGRRKPYLLLGAVGCAITLFLFPFVGALWAAVVLLWLLDISNNTSMEPYKALLADVLPKNQLARGFLIQSMFTGAGLIAANAMIFIFQRLITGSSDNGVPYWVFVAFWTGAFCSIASVLVAMLRTKEHPPSDEQLAEIRNAPKNPFAMVRDVASAAKSMPMGMHKLGIVYLFQWYAIVIYWQFVAVSLKETVFDGNLEEAVGWTGAMGMAYNGATVASALLLIPLANRFGAKRLHAACLVLMCIAMITVSQATNQFVALIPMVLFGIGWASMMGVPFIMVASMVPQRRMGVYIGIVNMMIVVPMLIQSFTFGWIFENLLGGSGSNALMLSGVLFGIGALAMLWVNPPPADEESPLMPLGTRHLTVYERVVVGTDGSPSSQYAVHRAAEVATASEAHLIVVSAYNKGDHASVDTGHIDLTAERSAREAIATSLSQLDKGTARRVEQRAVAADPSRALLDTARGGTGSLIVVGNRGLGAADGQLLGSVPANVVKEADCDVLIVQTAALDEPA